ncbi:hypothetical protein Sjap_019562 [Stephania japonica]|uniref:Uncharacterized protein n=1 Tax=Stephania japonica TaxID=461633 RepID=A0AAP0F6A9_9MAGN
MEGEGKNKLDPYPQLLDLIHKDKEWVVRGEDEKNRFGVSEEKKLELRLGPPGDQDWFINDTENNSNKNNKNWLMNNMNHKVMCSPWSSSSSVPQHVKQTYLQTCSTKAVGDQDKNACSASAAAAAFIWSCNQHCEQHQQYFSEKNCPLSSCGMATNPFIKEEYCKQQLFQTSI